MNAFNFKSEKPSVRSGADKLLYAGLLMIIAVVFALLELWMPLQVDDMAFMALYHDYNGGSDEFSLQAFYGYFAEMRELDNSRISNLLAPFSTIIRPWCLLFPYITGIVTAFVVDMIRRLGNMKISYFAQGVMIWMMMILFLPWRNYILVYDYMLNYIYSAAVTLLFVWMLCVKLPHHKSSLFLIVTTLLAIVAGGWHEGFALPVLCGLCVEYFMSGCRKPWRWYVAVSVYVAASALFALSPGILSRFSREVTTQIDYPLYKTAADLSLAFLLVINIVLFAVIPRTRKILKERFDQKDHLFLIFSVATVVGIFVSLLVEHTPRTSFWPEMCAMISFMQLYGGMLKGGKYGKTIGILASIGFVLLTVESIHILNWQYRYKEEGDILMAELKKSPTGTVFYDIIMPEELPLTTLYINPKSSWVTGFHFHSIDRLLGKWGHIVVPESLRNPRQDAELKSDNGEIFATGDALWTKYIPDMTVSGPGTFKVTMNDGRVVESPGLIHPFVVSPGDTLTYIKVYRLPVSEMKDVEITSYTHLTPTMTELRRVGRPFLKNEEEVVDSLERARKRHNLKIK